MEDYTPVQSQNGGGAAIASLVCGLIALLTSFLAACCYWVIPVPLALAGIVTGFMGMKSDKRGMAIAGLICSIIALLISSVWFILFLIGLAAGGAQQ